MGGLLVALLMNCDMLVMSGMQSLYIHCNSTSLAMQVHAQHAKHNNNA
jgi:hypothetical protein